MQAQGNAAFSAGDFENAIKFFTQAIEVDPSNHVLYSNRSAAKVRVSAIVAWGAEPSPLKHSHTLTLIAICLQASVKEYAEALEDAQKVGHGLSVFTLPDSVCCLEWGSCHVVNK